MCTNKKPAELCASAGLELVLLANSAAHPRRRAMRVMVVMMVASQHERFKLREGRDTVNSKDSIRMIGFRNAVVYCCHKRYLLGTRITIRRNLLYLPSA
jgi:hypothetical protein